MADKGRRDGGVWNPLLSSAPVWVSGVWYLVAMLACLLVLLINGTPLYYYDTGGYLAQGDQFLKLIGLAQEHAAAGGAVGSGAEPAADDTVQGNRSLIYGIVLSAFQKLTGLFGVAVAQSALLILTLWLSVRFTLRVSTSELSVAAATGLSVFAACLGSAPFYTAYLMPDIFAPILILTLAALSTFIGSLRAWEIVICFVLAAGSVVMHPSHLLMALMFIPVAPVAAFLSGRRRVFLSVFLVGSVALVGIAERFVFTIAAEKVADSEVVYHPFLTARLIVDGPGLDYLEDVCPEAKLATCDLIEKFERPYQITATHIVFETTEELGSFRLLPDEIQKQIVREQRMLLFEVIRTRPIGLIRAVGYNVLAQAIRVTVKMTLPDEEILQRVEDTAPPASTNLAGARLTDWQGWLKNLSLFHYAVYSASALVVLVAIFWRRVGVNGVFRVFSGMVLFGILTNAFVLGALSQPADRYGARVIFLLPALAALVLLLSVRRANSTITEPAKSGPAA